MKAIAVEDEPWMLRRFIDECDNVACVEMLGGFRSPAAALKFARKNRLELAFLDVVMPEMDGFALSGELRKLWPGIAIIFVSAHDRYVDEALSTGAADAYILKPYDACDISAAIGRALGRGA